MKISTKTGDAGRTKLMFGRDVSKSSQRVRAYGAVDDFSATLGLARSFAGKELGAEILGIQESLVCLMTELATKKEDFHLLTEKKIAPAWRRRPKKPRGPHRVSRERRRYFFRLDPFRRNPFAGGARYGEGALPQCRARDCWACRIRGACARFPACVHKQALRLPLDSSASVAALLIAIKN